MSSIKVAADSRCRQNQCAMTISAIDGIEFWCHASRRQWVRIFSTSLASSCTQLTGSDGPTRRRERVWATHRRWERRGHSLPRTRSDALAPAHSLRRTRSDALAPTHSLRRTRSECMEPECMEPGVYGTGQLLSWPPEQRVHSWLQAARLSALAHASPRGDGGQRNCTASLRDQIRGQAIRHTLCVPLECMEPASYRAGRPNNAFTHGCKPLASPPLHMHHRKEAWRWWSTQLHCEPTRSY